MKYNIFVSYRRTSAETANLIAVKLRGKGYNVFFDVESLRGGKFNEQLFDVIDRVDDVVVVLPAGALDRCLDEDDWVRKEVCYAMAKGKNIVPVMLNGFDWPDPMPHGMEELKDYQAVTAVSNEYFDMAVDRMCKYLKSRPHMRIRKAVMATACVVAGLLAVLFVADAILKRFSVPVCTEVADKLTMKMGVVDMLAADNKEIKDLWLDYKSGKVSPTDMMELIDFKAGQLADLEQQSRRFDVSFDDKQKFLIMYYGIDGAELDALNPCYEDFFKEYANNVAIIRQAVETGDKSVQTEEIIETNFEVFMRLVNAGYYSYLEFISKLPKAAQKSYWMIGDKMLNMPNGVGLNHTKEEFEQFVNREIEEVERLMQPLYKNLTDTKEKVRLEEEKIARLSKQMMEMYAQFKVNNSIVPEDNQWQQFDKIARYGGLLYESVQDDKEAKMDGFVSGMINPSMVYNDILSSLDLHLHYFPEAQGYVSALKLFYKEVLDGKRDCTGQVVVGFEDNLEHPCSRAGDIVVARNGIKVTDFASLQNALQKDRNGTITYLRVVDGMLVEITENVAESQVLVGYKGL